MLRLAEIYLNYAEAEFKLGNVEQARIYVNKIRSRKGVEMPEIPAGQMTWDKYVRERTVELAFEGQRWFDLVRVLNGQYGLDFLHSIGKTNATTKHLLFPIPQIERDRNPKLTQNPGY